MGIFYRGSDGTERVVAGLAPAGQLVPSVSLYQKGRVTATNITAGGYVIKDISFANTMPNTDYIVVINNASNGYMAVDVVNKTTSGFTAFVYNRATSDIDTGAFDWQAFKLMTDDVTALDEAKIEQNTKNFAPNFSATSSYAVGDYVTYNNVLYRCTVQHTASAWNSSHFTQMTVGGILGNLDKYSYLTCSQSWIGEWTEFGTNWTPFYSFTAPYSGKYRLHSSLIYNINNTSAINVNLRYYNTSIPTTIHLGQIASYGNSRHGINMDCIVELNANDVVQLQFQSEDAQTIRWIQRDNNRGDYWQYLG